MVSIRQAKHPLGDDVQLDLGRAALDRIGFRAQPFPRETKFIVREAFAVPSEALETSSFSPVSIDWVVGDSTSTTMTGLVAAVASGGTFGP
jgi:hypothetical protein